MTSTVHTSIDPGVLRGVLGAFPSGVVAVAGRIDGQIVGIAASSFTSISLDPPLVSIAVAKTSATWPQLRRSERLGVSVLADHHDVVCRQLAGPQERRFDNLALRSTREGAILLDEAVATFDCTIDQEVEAGDHLLILLRVHEAVDAGHHSPLVFHRSAFSKLHVDDLDPSQLQGRINGEPVPESTTSAA